MDKIKINKDSLVSYELDFRDKISSMKLEGEYLKITLDCYYKISVNDIIKFKRSVYTELTDDNTCISVAARNVEKVVHTEDNKTEVYVYPLGSKRINLSHIEDDLDDEYTRFIFDSPINIFAQDVICASGASILWYNSETEAYEEVITDLRFDELISVNEDREYKVENPREPEKFIFNYWDEKDLNCSPENVEMSVPMYYYIPGKTNVNVIWGKTEKTEGELKAHALFYKWNDFYYVDENNNCYFFSDVNVDGKRPYAEDNRYNEITVVEYNDYWRVPVGFSNNMDSAHLYQEQNVTEKFVSEVKELVAENAPVIDMEKVKFAPYYIDDDSLYAPLTSVTYNLHFRVRDLEEDGWQYADDVNEQYFWNSDTYPSNLANKNVSDMLYYLGFTDSDVQNQKMKLKKSFIRLSFYDSTDMLTQKLLYYTSVFIDSGELFGKYIKAKTELANNNLPTTNIVLSSSGLTNNRLDCHFTVHDEYYTEKSSDGFNIYYFPDVVEGENSERTIYMKVEFNHAKYGITIPMMLWPNNEKPLTIEDAKKGLYIPIKLKYATKSECTNNEKTYVYLFDTEENDYINIKENTVTLNLVEPRLYNGSN